MKRKEWNEGLDHLDPDLVEQYVEQKDKLRKRKKARGIWLRMGAIAACFALIVSAITVMPRLWGDQPGSVTPPNDTPPSPIIFDATVSPEKLSGSNLEFIVGSSAAIGDGAVSQDPPAFEFPTGGFAVKARVVKNHPDLYYKLDVKSDYKPIAYRLIQMETLETIHGENIPQYFLYLIRDACYVDLSVYDSLIIAMSQIGAENYVLKNQTKNQMEAFALPVFADYQNRPELGSIIAFSDGVFDESLWQNKGWGYGYSYLDEPQHNNLVVYRGDSESDVIAEIKRRNDDLSEWLRDRYKVPSPWTLDFSTQEAKDAIAYVKPFVNGVFSQYRDPYFSTTLLIFRRYINGCQTEEMITIDLVTEEVTYSEVRYTKEDMERLENISAHLSEKAKKYTEELPAPPHTDPEGKELNCLNLYAWYVKIDDKLYGVIKTTWRYLKYVENTESFISYYEEYYDDSYILYDMTDSTATNVSRDDLVEIVGTRNVYMGEYGVGVEVPMF